MKNSETTLKKQQKTTVKTDGRMRYELRRKQLIDLSGEARRYRADKVHELMVAGNLQEAEIWAFKRVNDIIADWYREQTGCKVFKTFNQWKQENKSVIKGSKSFILWGKKRKSKVTGEQDETAPPPLRFEPPTDEPSEHEYDFFPLAYLFSDLQVEESKERKLAVAEPDPTPALLPKQQKTDPTPEAVVLD